MSDETLGIDRGLHGRSLLYSPHEPAECYETAQIETHEWGGKRHDKQIGISDGEMITDQPAGGQQLPIHAPQALETK